MRRRRLLDLLPRAVKRCKGWCRDCPHLIALTDGDYCDWCADDAHHDAHWLSEER